MRYEGKGHLGEHDASSEAEGPGAEVEGLVYPLALEPPVLHQIRAPFPE